MDDCVAVTLLRHGLTLMNKEQRYIGWMNCSLSHDGVIKLKKCANLYPAADLVYSSDLKANHHFQNWLSDFYHISPPNGEHYGMFSNRLMKGWKNMTKQFRDKEISTIVIVTHGGPIRELMSKFAPVPKPFWEWGCGPGTGYQLRFDRYRVRRGERCISLREVPLTENVSG